MKKVKDWYRVKKEKKFKTDRVQNHIKYDEGFPPKSILSPVYMQLYSDTPQLPPPSHSGSYTRALLVRRKQEKRKRRLVPS
jgi:hypothetical protein